MKPWTTCEGSGPSRRQVLTWGSLALMGWGSRALGQVSFGAKESESDVLVVIFLRGGMDGLNFLVPRHEDAYFKERPSLALGAKQTLTLTPEFGLHPNAAGFREAWEDGELALIPACGSQDLSRSHFEAMKAMETGRGNANETDRGGWVSRLLRLRGGVSHPLQAIAFSDNLPDSLTGGQSGSAFRSVESFTLAGERRYDALLHELYAHEKDAFARTGAQTLRVLNEVRRMNLQAAPDHGAIYPSSDLGLGLRQTAMLVKAGVGLEVACLDLGGWDSHILQGSDTGLYANNVRDLSDSVAAFRRDLGPLRKRVTILVQTEFGRRVAENASLGTDHGRASVAMVLSPAVKPGIHGVWPGLRPDQRDEVGDLKVGNDYRDVLAELATARLGIRSEDRLFVGHHPRPLGLF